MNQKYADMNQKVHWESAQTWTEKYIDMNQKVRRHELKKYVDMN